MKQADGSITFSQANKHKIVGFDKRRAVQWIGRPFLLSKIMHTACFDFNLVKSFYMSATILHQLLKNDNGREMSLETKLKDV